MEIWDRRICYSSLSSLFPGQLDAFFFPFLFTCDYLLGWRLLAAFVRLRVKVA